MTRVTTFALTGLLLLAFATPNLAEAKSRKSRGASKPAVTQGGSGETTKERDRRLKRECKGRPNAGACLGYAY